MADKQNILTAIKNLDHFLKIPALQGARARINGNGSPFAFVGGFNMVFQLTHNLKKWAFRVWHVPMGELKDRFYKISKYLEIINLPYFAEFIFDENGLLVDGKLIDTIRMEWLDGLLLKEYIEDNLANPNALSSLAAKFLKMCQDLRENHISHGDLQEGNILVTASGDIKLVDYDSICIPEIEGQKELVSGKIGYQHPSRFKGSKASLKADYFSELVIYISIIAIAENPKLWSNYDLKDTEYLLFSDADLENFEDSKIYRDLNGLSKNVDELLGILLRYLEVSQFTDLVPFSQYLKPPQINYFRADKQFLIDGQDVSLEWEVENASEVRLNANIGLVNEIGNCIVKAKANYDYKIRVTGYSETIDKTLQLKVFPTPIINSLQVATPSLNITTQLNIKLPSFKDFVDIPESKIAFVDQNKIVMPIESIFLSKESKDLFSTKSSIKNLLSKIQSSRNFLIKFLSKSNEKNQ